MDSIAGERYRPAAHDILATLRTTARMHGYAVAVHGSLSRDLDVIAVPWGEVPSSAEELVAELVRAVGGMVDKPAAKPHRRMAWAVLLPGGVPWYIDLSVILPTRHLDSPAPSGEEAPDAQ